jgi:hypothetical protein
VLADVAALPLEEKGFLLVAVLARLPAAVAEARLGGEAGARCGAALAALAATTRATRVATTVTLLAIVRAPVPAGIELVHPGWLRERLVGESNAVIRAVTADLPPTVRTVADQILEARTDEPDGAALACTAAGLAELRRAVFGGLVPMIAPGGPTGRARGLVSLTPAALAEEIARHGAGLIGVSLQGAPTPVVARAAAAIGESLAPALLAAARRAGPPGERDRARLAVAGAPAGRGACLALGLPVLAARLAAEGTGAVAAVAQRLPPETGRPLAAAAGLTL